MLKALDFEGNEILAWEAIKKAYYVCPNCKEKVIYKSGRIVSAHFAHKVSNCPLSESYGEGLRHQQMKYQMIQLLRQHFPNAVIKPEYSFMGGKHFADLLVCIPLKVPFVVECQASSILIPAWEERTKDYNKLYAVLWIWDIKRLGSKNYQSFDDLIGIESRVPKEVMKCQQLSYGKIYSLDSRGELRAIRASKTNERNSEWFDETGDEQYSSYTPKTLKLLESKEIIGLNPTSKRHAETGIKLVELGDRVWWEIMEEKQRKQDFPQY